MSKCSVDLTLKSNFWYWTLFCPKYCACAVEALPQDRQGEQDENGSKSHQCLTV